MAILGWVMLLAVAVVGVMLATGGARILRPELSAGLRPELLDFLAWWELHGAFDLVIAGPDALWTWVPRGGVRQGPDDEATQAAAFKEGLTLAKTLADTAHGRAAALDAWPVGFDPRIPWERQPATMKLKFAAYGAAAEARGLRWGGRWVSFGGGAGDQPHVEVPHWRTLPVGAYRSPS